jgi:phosphohistidine phosphatase
MPRLLLLRHATAERARSGASDHARILTKEGRKQSQEAGRLIAGRGDTIDLVLSSDSARTRETWEGVAPHLKEEPEVRLLRRLYDATDTYIPILRSEGGAAETILVVGHNPTIHATASRLAADLAGRDAHILAERFPKSALAVLDFDGEWANVHPRVMRLAAFVLPARE